MKSPSAKITCHTSPYLYYWGLKTINKKSLSYRYFYEEYESQNHLSYSSISLLLAS